jgi:hypothetical protein
MQWDPLARSIVLFVADIYDFDRIRFTAVKEYRKNHGLADLIRGRTGHLRPQPPPTIDRLLALHDAASELSRLMRWFGLVLWRETTFEVLGRKQ